MKGSHMSESATVQEQGEDIAEFLQGLVDAFGLVGDAHVRGVEDEYAAIDVDGADLGLLIGPRGQTLQALHELSKTVLQRRQPSGPRARLRLDVGGYRAKRRVALANFVTAKAEEVRTSGEQIALEPMNAADRKVVHDTVNDLDGVATVSEGSEPRRRVVIAPAD